MKVTVDINKVGVNRKLIFHPKRKSAIENERPKKSCKYNDSYLGFTFIL